MISLFKGLIKFHLIPISIAIALLFTADYFFSIIQSPSNFEKSTIQGNSNSKSALYSNCINPQAEIELMASLENEDFITLFGSSELQELPYSPYLFLPDTLGINLVAFGHAHQQNLSIACQLLAAGDRLEGAKVCIALSPGWFQTEGTNIEAFIEFVRPNFLRSIIGDKSIPMKNKLYIAQFVSDHYNDIEAPSIEFLYLKNLTETKKHKGFSRALSNSSYGIKKVDYVIKHKKTTITHKSDVFDWSSAKKRLEKEVLANSTNNSIFVNNDYFKKYLLIDGKFTKAITYPITIGKEFEDFQLVVDILKRKNCKATFILQPLNPYYYTNLSEFKPVISKIERELNKANFPFLNLFVYSEEEYIPGFLDDIMHPSNRGWMDMNEFLVKQYYE